MRPVLPVNGLQPGKPEIEFVDQFGWLKSPETGAGIENRSGKASKFIVNLIGETRERGFIARTPVEKMTSNCADVGPFRRMGNPIVQGNTGAAYPKNS